MIMSDRNQWSAVNELMEAIGITESADKGTEMQRWASEQGITRDLPTMAALTSEECAAFIRDLQSLVTGAAPGEDAA